MDLSSCLILFHQKSWLGLQGVCQTKKLIEFKLIHRFEKFANLAPEKKIDQILKKDFFHQIKIQELSLEEAIGWYTAQSFLYEILNKLFRCTVEPAQLYYIQPYFKTLFKSIRHLYAQQKRKKVYKKEFKCYRGGIINEQQLTWFNNNIGQIVINNGFLSASKDLFVIHNQQYISNVLFVIQVKNNMRNQQYDYGYAHVEKYSRDPQEREVIFNCLNTFKIKSVKYQEFYNKIQLQYGYMAYLINVNPQNLTTQQKFYMEIQQKKKRCIQTQNLQGYILGYYNNTFQRTYFFQGSSQYWQKYIELAKINKDKRYLVEGHRMLGLCYFQSRDYRKAYIELRKSKQILIQNFGEGDLVQGLLNNFMANTLLYLNKEQKAIQCYYKSLQIIQKYQNFEDYLEFKTAIVKNLLKILKESKKKQQLKQIKNILSQLQNKAGSLYQKDLQQYKQNILSSIKIGYELYDNKKYNQALTQQIECLQKIINLYSENNLVAAQLMYDISRIYQQIGNFQAHIIFLKRCLLVNKKIFGEGHQKYKKSLVYFIQACLQRPQMKGQLVDCCLELQNIINRYQNEHLIAQQIKYQLILSLAHAKIQNFKKSGQFFTKILCKIQKASYHQQQNMRAKLQKIIKYIYFTQQRMKWTSSMLKIIVNKINSQYLLSQSQVCKAQAILLFLYKLSTSNYSQIQRYRSAKNIILHIIKQINNQKKVKICKQKLKQLQEQLLIRENYFNQYNKNKKLVGQSYIIQKQQNIQYISTSIIQLQNINKIKDYTNDSSKKCMINNQNIMERQTDLQYINNRIIIQNNKCNKFKQLGNNLSFIDLL